MTRPARSWLVSGPVLFLVFFGPPLAWAGSTPVFAVPDEPAHAAKAVSVWYGQLSGPKSTRVNGARTFTIPQRWTPVVPCYAFRPNVTPNQCPPPLQGSTRVAAVPTLSATYPPLYFALVGWGGRWLPRALGVRIMRLASAVLGAALLAWAAHTLMRVMGPGLALTATLVAAAPMCSFLIGSVNPNGFEIAAAVALWAHVIALVRGSEREPSAGPPTAVLVGLVVSGLLLAFTRALSGPFVGVIVVLALVSGRRQALMALARRRATWIALGVLTVGALASLAIALGQGPLSSPITGGSAYPPGQNHYLYVLGQTPLYLQELLAYVGWLDTPPSAITLYGWLAAVFALVGGSVMFSRLRRNVGLALTIGAAVLLPVVIQGSQAGNSLIWQGRYILPIAVGVPLLAGLGISRGEDLAARTVWRLTTVVAVLVAVLDVHALWWGLHRYTLGLSSTALDISSGAWQPPLGSWFWLAIAAATGALSVVAVVMGVAPARRSPRPTIPS